MLDSSQEILPNLLGMTDEDLIELSGHMPEHVLRTLADGLGQTTASMPAGPAEQAKELDPGFRDRAHLAYLSDRLAAAVKDVENGQTRYLRVSMPPRSGKSLLTSVYLPIWLLRKHPDWKIGLISHSPSLAVSWGRAVRRHIEEHGASLGMSLSKDAGAASEWQTTKGGGIVSRSAPGQSITGLGFKVMLIDDAVKDFASAHSAVQREALWEWWLANATTRLEPPSLVIVVGCLTADTPVLMADGTEKRIEHVRTGDQIFTYEDGRLTHSTVTNWANQGPDVIYRVTMESGRYVRGNAKHPFRVVNDEGVEEWVRLDCLRPGHRVLSAEETPAQRGSARHPSTAGESAEGTTHGSGNMGGRVSLLPTGASGQAHPARSQDASSPSVLRDSASRTTTKPAGQPDLDGQRKTPSDVLTCDTDTESGQRTTTDSLLTKGEYVRYARDPQMSKTLGGGESSSSTIATTPPKCGDFSATTAISSSATALRSIDFWLPPNTYEPGTDLVASVALDGHEDVYDIEVDRTHNYIANGLQVSNTRWHEDDFIGRLASHEYDGSPSDWEVIEFPAIATTDDVLGRAPGQPLFSPLIEESIAQALERWSRLRATIGSYAWNALYQQAPAPAKGAIFDVGWWRYWTHHPEKATDDGRVVYIDPENLPGARWLDSWDMAFKGGEASDFVVGQRWVQSGANRYLIASSRGRRTFTESLAEMRLWSTASGAPVGTVGRVPPYGALVHERVVEDKANGTAIIDTLKDEISGLVPVNPTESKQSRARAITPDIEAGNVFLPLPSDEGNEWVTELMDELRNFPTGAHDDQVDTLTQALMRLRFYGSGSVVVPGQGRAGGIERNIGKTALRAVGSTPAMRRLPGR